MQSFSDLYWVQVSPAEPASRAGVYVMKFPAGFIYCGASFNLRKRLAFHIGELQAGEHKNVRLQSAWEECSGEGVLISWRELAVKTSEELHVFEVRLLEHWRAKVGSARLLNVSLHPVPIRRRRDALNKAQSSTSTSAVGREVESDVVGESGQRAQAVSEVARGQHAKSSPGEAA